MPKEPSKNSTPKESNPAVKRHVKILCGIAGIWLLLFVVMMVERQAEVRVMLPVVTFVFIGYLIYATISVLSKRL